MIMIVILIVVLIVIIIAIIHSGPKARFRLLASAVQRIDQSKDVVLNSAGSRQGR